MKKILSALLILLILSVQIGFVKASPSEKMKGICIHGEEIEEEGAESVLKKIKNAGYNAVFLLIKNPQGEVYYKSNFFPVKYPVLQKVINAAKKENIKVYVYFPVFMDKFYGEKHPDALMERADGTKNFYYISLTNEEYFIYIKRLLSELALFDIDGITLDYIRFPNGSYDFSSSFENIAKQNGINFDYVKSVAYKTFVYPADWKTMFYLYGKDEDITKWVNLRMKIVQNEAYLLKNYIKALNPSLKVGAFIVARGFKYKIGETNNIKETYQYEIVNFAQGYNNLKRLDFIVPMVYLKSLKEAPEYAISVNKKLKENGKMNVYTGVNPYGINKSDTEKELFYAFSTGDGAVLFRYPIFKMGKMECSKITPGKQANIKIYCPDGKEKTIVKQVKCENFIPTDGDCIFISPFYQCRALHFVIGKKSGFKDAPPFYKNKMFLMDTAPFIKDNRTFVPIRFVSENLGALVEWNGEKREVTITQSNLTILMKIGSKKLSINGKTVLMDTAPFIKDNRTFVPIRFVSENLGALVEWNGEKREVTIEKLVRID